MALPLRRNLLAICGPLALGPNTPVPEPANATVLTLDGLVKIEINLPTDEEQDLLRRFTVNRNYLQAVAGFVTTSYGRREKLYEGLHATVEAMPVFERIQRSTVDLEQIRRFLTLAWTSEIQLHLPAIMGNNSMLAFANTWAPVHACYAIYGMLQAWFAANGMTGVADDHTATLRTVSKQIEQRDLFPEPWNLLAIGCPMRRERLAPQ